MIKLEHLPVETIYAIFEVLESPEDAVHFSLCSPHISTIYTREIFMDQAYDSVHLNKFVQDIS